MHGWEICLENFVSYPLCNLEREYNLSLEQINFNP